MRKLTFVLVLASSLLAAQPHKTRNIILVTADGLRWQELFTGIDPLLMNEKTANMKDDAGKSRRERYGSDSAEDRRKKLMPFFWNEFVPGGVVFGNVKKGSSVRVTNAYR